jgi:hypothetical protein
MLKDVHCRISVTRKIVQISKDIQFGVEWTSLLEIADLLTSHVEDDGSPVTGGWESCMDVYGPQEQC